MSPPAIDRIAYLIGMPRAGTTFLYHNLGKHPHVFLPFRRKTNYFSLHFDRSSQWFLDHFASMTAEQTAVDTETLYFVDPHVNSLERIHALNPDARVMLIVRRPAHWAWSFYRQIATFERQMPSFERFLDGGYVLIEDNKPVPFTMRDGDIERNIRKAIGLFQGNLLLVNFSLIETHPLRVLQEIEGWLGVPPYFADNNFDNRKINAADRGHIVFLAKLLRSRWVIDLVRWLPARLVTFIRGGYDAASARLSAKKKPDNAAEPPDIALAAERFRSDELYVASLFTGGDIRRL